jgi:hypothetical protein
MEQEINNIQEKAGEKVVIQAESKDLFESYEMGKTKVTSIFQKIIAGTIAFHILALFTLSQTGIPLGKAKPCSNPLMQTVCEVIDAAYVGGVLMTTDRTSVDAPYDKTELEDAEITFIDVTNAPPTFTYPEGYFANEINAEALPGEMLTDANGNPVLGDLALNSPNSLAPGIPGFPNSGGFTPNPIPSTGTLDPNKPADLPKGGGDTLIGDIPGITSGTGKNPIPRSGKRPDGFPRNFPTTKIKTPKMTPSKPTVLDNNSPGKLGFGEDTDVANSKPRNPKEPGKNGSSTTVRTQPEIKSDPVEAVVINKRAFEGLLALAKTVDTTQNFKVVMRASLTKDGKFDVSKDKKTGKPKSFFVVDDERGDEKIVGLVRSAIERTGDSGWFGYLAALKVDMIEFTVTQDENNLVATLVSNQPNEQTAKTISSGFNGLIASALFIKKDLGEDERTLLKGAKVSTIGKNFVLNFTLKKEDVQALIKAQIEKDAAKAAMPPQSNNLNGLSPSDITAK